MNKNKMIKTVESEMPEFVSEVSGLAVDALEDRLVQLVRNMGEVNKAKEEDEGLAAAREAAKQANAPYVEAKKAIRLKIDYLLHLSDEKGE